MDVHAASRDQRSLRDEQKNPAGKCGSVQVTDQSGERRGENSSEIVGRREADENGCQHSPSHDREKEMIVTAAGQNECGFSGIACTSNCCGHCLSLNLDFLELRDCKECRTDGARFASEYSCSCLQDCLPISKAD